MTLDDEMEDLTTLEVARILNLKSRYTVYRMIRSGELGAYRLPGSNQIRVPRSELDRIRRVDTNEGAP